MTVTEKQLIADSVRFDINQERRRQEKKWGEQNHNDFYWYGILGEEFGEVGKALIEQTAKAAPPFIPSVDDPIGLHHLNIQKQDISKLRKEIIQVAAVSVAWLEAIERRLSK